MVRRANEKIDPITESYYKHVNENDIEDLYRLCVNGKVKDYKEIGLLGSLKKLLTITFKPVIDMIYENNKKEKRVMILKEIPEFYDATLKRVLEMLKKYNKDVKYGYADPNETLGNVREWKMLGLKDFLSAVEVTAAGYASLAVEGFVNSSKILEKQENKSDKGYHEVPPPFTGNYMPSKRNLRLIDEHFESESVDVSTISSSDGKTVKTVDVNGVVSKEEPKLVKKNNFSLPIIEDGVSESEEENKPKFQKQVQISLPKIEFVKAKDQN
nr:hypothetical protein [Tanacetum cinerariifolium]